MSELDVIQETEVEPVENTEAQAETAEQETEVEAQAETEETATSDAEPEQEKPKRRSRAEERINALTREKYEAQKAAEHAQRQMAELQRAFQEQQQRPQQTEMPKLADYDYDEGRYQSAVHEWNNAQLQQQQDAQRQQAEQWQQQQEAIRQQQVLQQKISEGQEKYPDFISKVNDPSLPPLRDINPYAFQAVINSDAAADVAYYLASNPQEVYSLASMDPVTAIKTVAQLEAKITAKPVQAKAPPPKPPTRLSGNSEAVKDPQKMTTEEWMEWRNRQVRSK